MCHLRTNMLAKHIPSSYNIWHYHKNESQFIIQKLLYACDHLDALTGKPYAQNMPIR